MSLIIGIDMGHTISGPNYGAVGILKESEETRNLGRRVIKYLNALDHKIINCTVDKASSNSESLNSRIAKANAQKLDLFLSIHFNVSLGGTGCEIYTYNGRYLSQGDKILKGLSGILHNKKNLRNRGIKNGTSPVKLAVINKTKAPAMLLEVCFIDNQSDVDLYKNNIDTIAKIITEGLTGQSIGKK